jgi:hypothetical protein
MQIIKAAVWYFALVFSAGFVLGTIRVLLIIPRIGVRMAELMETPVMIVISFVAAPWIIRRFAVAPSTAERIGIGIFALALLLFAEFTFVRWFQGWTISEYVATRDPVSGTVYMLALGLFALMPLWV